MLSALARCWRQLLLLTVVLVVTLSQVNSFKVGVKGTRCNLDPHAGEINDACQFLYDGVCGGKHCICPPNMHEDPVLKMCVPGAPKAKPSGGLDLFDDLPFDYVPPGEYYGGGSSGGSATKSATKPAVQPHPPQPQPGPPPQPGYNPNQPQPGYNPNQPQPGYNPNQPQPGYNPNQPQPGYNPNQPQPGYIPNQPQPGYNPNQPQPGYNPNQPQPGYNPNQLGVKPTKPGGYNPNQPGYSGGKKKTGSSSDGIGDQLSEVTNLLGAVYGFTKDVVGNTFVQFFKDLTTHLRRQ